MKTICLALTAAVLATGPIRPVAACDPSAPDGSQPPSIMVVPGELDLGRPDPATIVTAAVWLVNTSDESVELLSANHNDPYRAEFACRLVDGLRGTVQNISYRRGEALNSRWPSRISKAKCATSRPKIKLLNH